MVPGKIMYKIVDSVQKGRKCGNRYRIIKGRGTMKN